MKKIIWVVGFIIIIYIIISLLFNTKNSGDSIKIGAALALTGDAAPWGEESLLAAQMAIDEINSKGGINGKDLELVVEDIKSSSKDSVSAVSKLINTDKVKAVMITWLDSYQGSESIVPQNILLISQDAAIESVNVPVNHQNVFSLWYRTKAKAQVTMDAMRKGEVEKLYIVLQNDSYYSKLKEFLLEEARLQGIQIVGQELINPDNDVRTVITKINEQKPDAVFFGSYDPKLSFNFIKTYREIISNKIALYGDEFIEQDLGDSNFSSLWLEGVKYYVPSTPDKNFSDKFNNKFKHKPMFSAGTTYDTIYLIAKYLTDQPQDISDYMRSNQFDTITYGPVTFDEIGGVIANKTAIMMREIKGGKSVPVQ